MQLADVLTKNRVFLNFTAESKDQSIEKFISLLEESGSIKDPAVLKDALFEREKLGTTGVGFGIAMPHARSGSIKDLTVAFFRSEKGFDFKAIDGAPVQIVFLLLAPISSGGPYLKLLAKISRLLRSDDFKKSLLDAKDEDEIIQIIKDNDN